MNTSNWEDLIAEKRADFIRKYLGRVQDIESKLELKNRSSIYCKAANKDMNIYTCLKCIFNIDGGLKWKIKESNIEASYVGKNCNALRASLLDIISIIEKNVRGVSYTNYMAELDPNIERQERFITDNITQAIIDTVYPAIVHCPNTACGPRKVLSNCVKNKFDSDRASPYENCRSCNAMVSFYDYIIDLIKPVDLVKSNSVKIGPTSKEIQDEPEEIKEALCFKESICKKCSGNWDGCWVNNFYKWCYKIWTTDREAFISRHITPTVTKMCRTCTDTCNLTSTEIVECFIKTPVNKLRGISTQIEVVKRNVRETHKQKYEPITEKAYRVKYGEDYWEAEWEGYSNEEKYALINNRHGKKYKVILEDFCYGMTYKKNEKKKMFFLEGTVSS